MLPRIRYHGLSLDTFCLMGELWSWEIEQGTGYTIRQAADIMQCTVRIAAKVVGRLVQTGHLRAEGLSGRAKVYRADQRWLVLAASRPGAVPGACAQCGELSLPYPFEGRFLCGPCLRRMDALHDEVARLLALPFPDAVRGLLDARPGQWHTAAGVREVLDDHPTLAPYGWMGREQLCARALSALPHEHYGLLVDQLGRRAYWRRAHVS